MSTIVQNLRGQLVNLIPAGSALTTVASVVVTPSPFSKYHQVTVTGSAGVASGAVTIESASDPTYSGTWNPVGTTISPAASSVISQNFTGIYKAIRARISTVIGSGTVQVDIISG
jgi:hypothetical protein